ncbi:hypothetical protein [Paracidovorax wautersii]|uniref:Competence protein CoiA-like family protein n=1 Tax=Paracidovorax wautersii TaxID=1177982 RepID=A0A1I2HPY4_9BURK|nr:hypothetical protein [Paracidovorax wautersii]SFF32395.1 hypothetical protein SAMN04489711_13010 [Paracidovorax wautersii]
MSPVNRIAEPAAEAPAPLRVDKPMCWAINKETRRIVHVSDLDRAHTGLKCGCICPACESDLQAVNAGRDGAYFRQANSRGQFFRHQSGQQRDQCLLLVAHLTALQLLYDREEIDVPPPRRRASIHGVSGQIYESEVFGTRTRLLVRAREWVDSQAARLTLDDGRVILLKLESAFAVDEAGVYSGVITVQTNDPAIASWSREEILAKAVLDDGLLCWQRHWDDQALEAQAMHQAEQAAVQALDHLPGSGQEFKRLTVPQQSESVLHATIKRILEEAGGMKVPPYMFEEVVQLPDGKTWREPYGFPFGFLRMVDVRLEQVMGRIVPDVLCRACTPEDDFPLMIEVVVTHPVTQEKLQVIQAQGVACLQIDVSHFHRSGRMTLDGLKWEVLENPGSKRWLFHPGLAERRVDAKWRCEVVLQKMLAEVQRGRALLDRVWDTPPKQLPALLLQLVLENERCLRSGLPSLIDFQTILAALKANGWDANDAPLLQPSGVLSALAAVKDDAKRDTRRVLDVLRSLSETPRVRVHTGLILIAVKVYGVVFSPLERTEYLRIRKAVRDSLQAGELQFGRPTRHDNLIGWIFPELAPALGHHYGTAEYARQRHDAIRKAAEEHRRREMAEFKRRADALDHARQVLAVDAAIAGSREKWQPPLAICRDFEQALQSAEVRGVLRRMRESKIDFKEALATAFLARDAGVPVASWIRERMPADLEQIRELKILLRSAWLIL